MPDVTIGAATANDFLRIAERDWTVADHNTFLQMVLRAWIRRAVHSEKLLEQWYEFQQQVESPDRRTEKLIDETRKVIGV